MNLIEKIRSAGATLIASAQTRAAQLEADARATKATAAAENSVLLRVAELEEMLCESEALLDGMKQGLKGAFADELESFRVNALVTSAAGDGAALVHWDRYVVRRLAIEEFTHSLDDVERVKIGAIKEELSALKAKHGTTLQKLGLA